MILRKLFEEKTEDFTFDAEAWLLSRGLMRQPKAMQVRTRQAVIRIAYSHPSAVINLKFHIWVMTEVEII